MTGTALLPAATQRMQGFGMVEFMIALLVFSLGLAGARSAQQLARQATFESLQVTQASIHARDMLERVASNPGALSTYIALAGQWDGQLAEGDVATDRATNRATDSAIDSDEKYGACDLKKCTVVERAKSDVLQWHAGMLGAATLFNGEWVSGLPDVRACIANIGNVIEVRVSWAVSSVALLRPDLGCLERSEGAASRRQSRLQVRLSAILPTVEHSEL